jgi:hypothetical protein
MQLAAKLRSDPEKSARLAELLRGAPTEPAKASTAAPPAPSTADRNERARRRPGAVAAPHASAPLSQESAPPLASASPQTSAPLQPSTLPQEPAPPPEPHPPAPPQEATAPPAHVAAEPGRGERTVVVGGMEVTVVEAGAAPTEPIRLPASFEAPAEEAAPQLPEETMARLAKMKADDIETLVRSKIGSKADGLAEALRALPPEALPFAIKMFPPDALRALM